MADDSLTPFVLSYKYRLLPSAKQHAALAAILESQRQFYNGALEHRIGAYRRAGRTVTLYEQQKELTELRRESEFGSLPLALQRWTLRRLDEAYTGFFRRIKSGGKAGFPRFRGKARWDSFGFDEFHGVRLIGNRLRVKGLPGGIRVHLHRALPAGMPRGCVIKRDTKGWSVCFQMRVVRGLLPTSGRQVGVDMGLSTLVMLSTGEAVPNPRHARRVEKQMRVRQRALARCRLGSVRRRKVKARFARLHARVRNARSTYLHQVTARLVRENDVIAVEKLNVKGLAQTPLAKSVRDAGWSKLKEMLAYKAEWAGRQLVEVNCRLTSQTCPACGQVAKKSLKDRVHACGCGCTMDRDHAAALVILHRAVARPGVGKPLSAAA